MPVKPNRFIQLGGGTTRVNRELEAKARALAGIKGLRVDRRTYKATISIDILTNPPSP